MCCPLVIKHAVDVISEHASTIAAAAAVSGNAVLSPCMSAHAPAVTARRIMLACAAYLGLKVLIMVTSVVQNLSKQVVSFDAERWFSIAIFSHFQQLGISYLLSKHAGELTRIMNLGTKSVTTILHQLVFFLAPTFLEALFISAVFWKLRTPVVVLSTVVAVVLCMVFTVVVAKHRVVVGRRLVDLHEDRAIVIINISIMEE